MKLTLQSMKSTVRIILPLFYVQEVSELLFSHVQSQRVEL